MDPNQPAQTTQVPPAQTPPPVPPPVNQTPPASHFPKIFLIAIVVFILVVLGAGAFVLQSRNNKQKLAQVTPSPTTVQTPTPTPDPTASWKIYTNLKYHYSFKYPPQFKLTEENKNNDIVQYFYKFSTGKLVYGMPDSSGFVISIFPTLGKTIEQEFSNKSSAMGVVGVTPIERRGADEAAHVTNIQALVVFRSENNFFEISGFQNSNTLPDKSDDVDIYFDQILSTFKFTDQNTNVTNISEPQNGTMVTVQKGAAVTVTLHSTYWEFQPISDATVLKPNGNSVTEPDMTVKIPGTGAGTITQSFTALSTGTATFSATRTTCGEALQCAADQKLFKVTIVVN
ncbi:MAG TPA: hypothetical protein VLF68_04150 [Candidatus Saccharimonadales bacterium]|nr:hypothetical protein [Candidatus Saccharimonadales bacterium]